ncbi:YqaJ viral recombinase family protein [Embleya sp. NPDC050154]|uniref:YqaJ viral recombinase family protein n=1 Tax=Embleya sp. NPDC050154 TaxID=3363988 RepID=UPI0037A4359F
MTAPTTDSMVTPTGRLVLDADADRDTWLAARRLGIGSSDVPDVLGVGDFGSSLRVYLDKVDELPDDAGDPAFWGTVLEEPIAREWARRSRSVVEPIGIVEHRDHSHHRATLDRRITECPLPETRRQVCALEVKTRSAFKAARWHAGAPDDVVAQVLWQMYVTGYDHMHYAVLIGGNDYRQGVIRADEYRQVTANIVRAVDRFWTEHVLARVAPPHSGDPARTVDLYRRAHPDRDGVVHLDDDPDALGALDDYETARLEAKAATKRQEAAHADLLRLTGRHRVAALGGKRAWSLEPATRSNVDLELLAEGWPDAYAACVTHKTGDRLDIDKAYRHKPAEEGS